MERTTTPMTPLTPRAPIDRRALVSRADVRVSSIDTGAFLSVGNGETAFTADVTGLQTLNATNCLTATTAASKLRAWVAAMPAGTGVLGILGCVISSPSCMGCTLLA